MTAAMPPTLPPGPPDSEPVPATSAALAARSRSRRTLILLALITIAPVVASYTAYYFFPRTAQTNYGTLLPVGPAQEFSVTTTGGAGSSTFGTADLKGRWTLLIVAPAGCDESCRRTLHATRQAVTMQGREQDRVARVWLATGAGAVPTRLAAEHAGLVVATAPTGVLDRWPRGGTGVYLVDPLGNWVLHYGVDPDIKGLAKDLTRVLKASRIG
jgi:hypothetical protein